ncbi:MAG: DUF1428 domain-containing protein [Bdellovibrionaceae bacterium]|nr:DUF1428 domain-containing protein [Pseudobdellovibrionaceae bacterium]NUM57160.1 DUF1428 domain-containing protein [Pseudobdellovibrionaceae bacterium]
MANYIDGFVIPIKKKNLKDYKKMAALGCKLWTEYGALSYYECVGDDLKVNWGLTFPRMCKLKADETAIFAFIVFKSKAHRDKVNLQVMKDPRMNMENVKIPFDMKRFAMGGFKTLVHSK